MNQDKCSTKRCRNTPVIEVKGKLLCQICWEKLCDKQTREEIRLYREMGLNVCLTKLEG